MDELRRSQRSRLLVSCSNPALPRHGLGRSRNHRRPDHAGRTARRGRHRHVGAPTGGIRRRCHDLRRRNRRRRSRATVPRDDNTAVRGSPGRIPPPTRSRFRTGLLRPCRIRTFRRTPMTTLVRAETLKVLTLRYWWALAIAPVVVAVLIAASTRTFVRSRGRFGRHHLRRRCRVHRRQPRCLQHACPGVRGCLRSTHRRIRIRLQNSHHDVPHSSRPRRSPWRKTCRRRRYSPSATRWRSK